MDTTNVHKLKLACAFHKHVFDKPLPTSNKRANFEATPKLAWRPDSHKECGNRQQHEREGDGSCSAKNEVNDRVFQG